MDEAMGKAHSNTSLAIASPILAENCSFIAGAIKKLKSTTSNVLFLAKSAG